MWAIHAIRSTGEELFALSQSFHGLEYLAVGEGLLLGKKGLRALLALDPDVKASQEDSSN
jgi:hypothetical protein